MKFLILISVLLLSGCAGWQIFKSAVTEEGAIAADEALQVAIFQICRGSPVGAVLRRFNTNELRDAYETICKEELPTVQYSAQLK
jgi:hypothetical protein